MRFLGIVEADAGRLEPNDSPRGESIFVTWSPKIYHEARGGALKNVEMDKEMFPSFVALCEDAHFHLSPINPQQLSL